MPFFLVYLSVKSIKMKKKTGNSESDIIFYDLFF